jgi:hypothetical protein
MTLAPVELATAAQREGLRKAFARSLDDALDALVEAQESLSVSYSAHERAVRCGDLTQAHREALELAQVELRLAAAVVVEARRRCLEFEAQVAPVEAAARALESTPWPA